MAIARSSLATPVDFVRELAGLGPTPPELASALAELEDDDAALDLLDQRLHEGRAKGVPGPTILAVLGRLAGDLAWLEGLTASCRVTLEPRERARLQAFAADAWLSGQRREALEPVVRIVCGSAGALGRLSACSELYFHLTQRLAAPAAESWMLMLALLGGSSEMSQASALVFVLQDIDRAHGSVRRAVELATRRLADGASPARVAHELDEQFLRR